MRKYLKIKFITLAILVFSGVVQAQEYAASAVDTIPVQTLDSITVNARIRPFNSGYMTDAVENRIYAGKRTNTVLLSSQVNGLAFNLGRTALAKIPGLTMWEMDGAGTQLNIGSRGTDPHRSIEMNMRQNGYNTNSDMFGYPENHYSVPMQAIEEIQLVRGSAALQFGPQFGGMMNYRMKEGDSSKLFSAEMEQTAGSNGFFNSYNAVGGTKGRFNYYAYYDNRQGKGWRNNAAFDYHAYYVHIGYQVSDRMKVKFEFSRMDYVQQITGGLTDQQFKTSASQSVRARNYFQPFINIPAVIIDYKISSGTWLEVTANAVLGQRNSVQFINPATIRDTINASLQSYNPRQVDRDYYNGYTAEARISKRYRLGNSRNIFAGGARFFSELTKRKQKGVGSAGIDFDLSLTKNYGIDLRLTTKNYALFAENIFQLTQKFSITPGFRYEIINTDLSGVINNRTATISYQGKRNFPLFGAGLQYQLSPNTQLFANMSQAYRPYLYANVTPADRLDQIDPDLEDSKGYDIDLGYRGHIGNIFQFDVDAFYLFYGNRVGLIAQNPGTGTTNLFTTNIGNSVAKGVELFTEVSVFRMFHPKVSDRDLRIFTSVAYDHATYTSGVINKSGNNISIEGNAVENAPKWIVKTGASAKYKKISSSVQYSYTDKSFNDAFNTISSTDGITGMIPAYHVWDWDINWQITGRYHASATVNNFTNQKYFNRRITFYPGPGILPADGRTFSISFGANF